MTRARPPRRPPLIVAHRGGTPNAVENSAEAFLTALSIGVDLIECDLRRCADGTIVLYHDERVGGVKVSALSLAELRARVPTLLTFDDLLMLLAGRDRVRGIALDLKERGIEGALIPILDKRPDIARMAVVSTVHTFSLRRLSRRVPGLRLALSRGHLLGWLPRGLPRRLVSRPLRQLFPLWLAPQVRWCGAGAVALQHDLLDENVVRRYHRMGLRVYAWTVDERDEAKRLANAGVDFIASNEPWELLGLFDRWPEGSWTG